MSNNENDNIFYIFGHKNPDTDSIASAISLSYLKNKLGFKTEPKTISKLNKETIYVLNKLNIPFPDEINEVNNNQKVILVDHNEVNQSVEGLNSNQITEIIDHHKISISFSNPIRIITMPYGSTCTIISILYQYYNIEIPLKIMKLLLYGIISDTLLFKSPTCTNIDITEYQKLQHKLNLTDEQIIEMGMDMFKEGSDIGKLPISELMNMDFKEIEINYDNNIGISQIITLNPELILKNENYTTDDIINYLIQKSTSKNYLLYILLVTDIIHEGSFIFYYSKNDKLINEIFDCESYQGMFIDKLISRKKQIVPKLSSVICHIN